MKVKLVIFATIIFSPFSAQAELTQRFFTTGQLYSANLGGVSGADQICQASANNANLGGSWKAVLSSSTIPAVQHVAQYGVIKDLKGQTLWQVGQMFKASPLARLTTTEKNETIYRADGLMERVWTATAYDGLYRSVNSSEDCKNWSVDDTQGAALVGNPYLPSPTTTSWLIDAGIASCSGNYRLYCLEQGESTNNVKRVFGYYESLFALTQTNQMFAWGENPSGNLGTGQSPYAITVNPSLVDFGSRYVKELAAGAGHTCAVLDDHSLACWGGGGYGQIGNGRSSNSIVPEILDLGSRFKSVAVGAGHTCAISEDGALFCWGDNTMGSTGAGRGVSGFQIRKVDLGGKTVKSVALGQYHSCAILEDDSLMCWGYNRMGQVGNGTFLDAFVPQLINLGQGRSAKFVIPSSMFTCAILDDGSAKCWGNNKVGQLGNGLSSNSPTPQTVLLGDGRTAKSLFAGGSRVCAVLDDSSVKCWGQQASLGSNGYFTNTSRPQAVNIGRAAQSVSIGEFENCALLDNGSVSCWGGASRAHSIDFGLSEPAISVLNLRNNSCAIFESGSLKCWGQNYNGQLGIGNTDEISTPVSPVIP